MEHLYNLNIGHLTISPSTMDQEKFRGYIPFIINWIFEKKSISFYSISEEYGSNDHLHLDIILFSKSDINKNILNNKGKQIGLSGHLKDFMDNHLPNTLWKRFYRYENENKKNSKEYNVKFLIGYNIKEDQKNHNDLPITKEEFEECSKHYQENKSDFKIVNKDVIPLNPKNAMFEMKKYLQDKENPDYHKLITDSIKKGYCWLGMSEKISRKLILQLKLLKNDIEKEEEDELNEGSFKKFETMELEQLKMIRQYNCPRENRLKMLYEYQFITKKELETLL